MTWPPEMPFPFLLRIHGERVQARWPGLRTHADSPTFATLLSLPPRRGSAASLTATAPERAFSLLRNSSQLSMLRTYSAFLQDVTVKL